MVDALLLVFRNRDGIELRSLQKMFELRWELRFGFLLL